MQGRGVRCNSEPSGDSPSVTLSEKINSKRERERIKNNAKRLRIQIQKKSQRKGREEIE